VVRVGASPDVEPLEEEDEEYDVSCFVADEFNRDKDVERDSDDSGDDDLVLEGGTTSVVGGLLFRTRADGVSGSLRLAASISPSEVCRCVADAVAEDGWRNRLSDLETL
jgi:hypothetical protein